MWQVIGKINHFITNEKMNEIEVKLDILIICHRIGCYLLIEYSCSIEIWQSYCEERHVIIGEFKVTFRIRFWVKY